MRELKLRRITRHLAAIGTRRVITQVIKMNRTEFIVTDVIGADVNAFYTENHVLFRWHQWRIPAMHRMIKFHIHYAVGEITMGAMERKLLMLFSVTRQDRK